MTPRPDPLDYQPSRPSPAPTPRLSALAVASCVLGLVSFPCLVSIIVPDRWFDSFTPTARVTAARLRMWLPPAAGLALAVTAAARVGLARGRLRGLALAAVGGVLCFVSLILLLFLKAAMGQWGAHG